MLRLLTGSVSVASGEEELLIERSAHTGMLNPGDPWKTIQHDGPVARLVYRVRVRCDDNYYGNKCNKVCVPRDDYFGHYRCEASGAQVCLDGWMGPGCSTGEHKGPRSGARLVGGGGDEQRAPSIARLTSGDVWEEEERWGCSLVPAGC